MGFVCSFRTSSFLLLEYHCRFLYNGYLFDKILVRRLQNFVVVVVICSSTAPSPSAFIF